ncbi:MAG: MATE family efflux transporter, partial [Acetatifactor sp.]|nr:MATE family efflux transporter [Acetatifactor sp.]
MSIRKKLFGDKAFYKMALGVAVPIMIQNGITNFVGLLDNIMVGRVGTEQMSGIAIVNQLLLVFNLAIFGAFSGAGIFTAQFYGCKDHQGVRHTFRFKAYIGAII